MKCLYESCENEVAGRSRYCSDKCKVAYNRNKKSVTVIDEVPGVTPKITEAHARQIRQPDISLLPDGVSKPVGKRNAETSKMTSQQLQTRLSLYNGLKWLESPEYAEIIHRLLTWSIEKLEQNFQSIPSWRLRWEAA